MDPNLFHLDWDRLFEVLATIIVLSFVLERALALVFEHRAFIKVFNNKGIKAPVAFLVSLVVCLKWQFDAVSMIILAEKTTLLGEVITAAVIAGGSKASIKLFHDVMDVRSDADRVRSRDTGTAADTSEAQGGGT